jgi:hypothetical protein
VLIDNLAKYYYASRDWRLKDAQEIKQLRSLKICTPFTAKELCAFQKATKSMYVSRDWWESKVKFSSVN